MAAPLAHGVWIDFRDLGRSLLQNILSEVFLVGSILSDVFLVGSILNSMALPRAHEVWIDLSESEFCAVFGPWLEYGLIFEI